MNLYKYLIIKKNYTEDESLETCLRYEHGLEIPEKVRADIKDFWKSREQEEAPGK